MSKIANVFISDVHLGAYYSKTDKLLEFLIEIKKHNIEKLYIVGDFIDGWKLKRNWYWDNNCNLIIRKILSMIKSGTEVYIVAGNHDEFFRDFIHEFKEIKLGSIHLGDEFIHVGKTGHTYLVLHGDRFDLVTKYAKWLCVVGDVGYSILLNLNAITNYFRKKFNLPYWSLSAAIKSRVKEATNYISDFEYYISKYATEKHCFGIIVGHIHAPDIRQIENVKYLNCGDWVENCTAIIEYDDGKMEIVNK